MDFLPKLARAKARVPFKGWTGVTRREGEAMWFIDWHTGRHGYAPSLRELAAHLGCCLTTAYKIEESLCAKKLLRCLPGRARAIELTRAVDTDLIAA